MKLERHWKLLSQGRSIVEIVDLKILDFVKNEDFYFKNINNPNLTAI